MTDFFTATDSGILLPTQLRTQVIPWEALNALNPPAARPQVSTDILSAFAVMVAKGPRAPALVGTDEHSKLLAAAEINQWTTIGRSNAIGDQAIMVSDPTYAGAGNAFLVFPASGTSSHGPYQVAGAGEDTDGTIHLTFGLQQNVAPGDGVRRLPIIGISSALNTVQVAPRAGNNRTLGVSFTNGAASILFSAFSPFAWILRSYSVSIRSSAAVQYGSDITFIDGAGLEIWADSVSIPATAGASDHANQTDLSLAAATNFSLTMALSTNLPLNVFATLSMACDLK